MWRRATRAVMADTRAGASTDADAGGAGATDEESAATHTNGSRLPDEQGRKGGRKGKGRKRGRGRHHDDRKASVKGREQKQKQKQKQRKRRKEGQRRGPSLELRPLAVLSALGGIAAGLVVGFVSGRSIGRH
jgi:hypothetical protein